MRKASEMPKRAQGRKVFRRTFEACRLADLCRRKEGLKTPKQPERYPRSSYGQIPAAGAAARCTNPADLILSPLSGKVRAVIVPTNCPPSKVWSLH